MLLARCGGPGPFPGACGVQRARCAHTGRQIPTLLGYHNVTIRSETYYTVYDIVDYADHARWQDALLGLACLALLLAIRYAPARLQQRRGFRPLSLGRNALVVVLAMIIAYACHSDGLDPFLRTPEAPAGMPAPSVPQLDDSVIEQLGVRSVIVALVGFLEAIAIGMAFGRKHGYRPDASQELVALGTANIIGSFFLSMPVTGSFSRTAINAQSGVRTPMGGAFTALMVILTLLFITPIFQFLPKAALAAIIMASVISMFDAAAFRTLWRTSGTYTRPFCAPSRVSLSICPARPPRAHLCVCTPARRRRRAGVMLTHLTRTRSLVPP